MIGQINIVQHGMQEGARHDDGGEQRNGHAQEEIDGETSHHARAKRIAEDEQNDASDECGNI